MRRRTQQEIHGHQGRKNDPLYGIRNILRVGEDNLTDRQRGQLALAWKGGERHVTVEVAWRCCQLGRYAYDRETLAAGGSFAERILDSSRSCPIPEIASLSRTLRQWAGAFLGYFDTHGANDGCAEAIRRH